MQVPGPAALTRVNAARAAMPPDGAMQRPSRLFLGIVAAALAGALLTAGGVRASRPVHKVMTGCVSSGVFTNANGYTIRMRWHRAAGDGNVDLTPYEGREIRANGTLLPGDRFDIRTAPEILGPCPADGTDDAR